MPHSFLIFDFGTNEEAAQQARHRLDGWKQGFRLDKKLQLKFQRKEKEAEGSAGNGGEGKAEKSAKTAPKAKGKAKAAGKSKSSEAAASENPAAGNSSDVRVIVRLDFSDHEKLSHQRWIERIPAEEPFKGASPKVIRGGEADFQTTSDLFDSLD